MKKFIKNYFNFTKKERRGILTICTCILVACFLPTIFPYFIKAKSQSSKEFEADIARLTIKQNDSSNNFFAKNYDEDNFQNYHQPNYKNYVIKGDLFYFDPNTINATDWKRLGVRDKTIATILNYTSKGGKFYKPEDLGKIWGFFPNEVDRLMPYVQIKEVQNDYANNYPTQNNYQTKTYDKPKYTPTIIDVNNADTTAYIALPGIGSKLAQRIITFREKLGGFYKIEQVAEIFGLPDSTFQKIKPRLSITNTTLKKININTATVDEMKTHPYLRYNIANAIVQYRTQHGNYGSTTDIKKIMIIDEAIFVKISPYLTIQ